MRTDPAFIASWPQLDFTAAWVDNGPSPAGNPGPYLKVPGGDDLVHRVYCKIQPGDLLRVAGVRGKVSSVVPKRNGDGWVWVIELEAI